jgi:glutamate-ammonia-ligase adenylyltransferase
MSEALADLIRQCPVPFDPGRAERTLETLGARAGTGAARDLIAATASNSPYLARTLQRDADFVPELLAAPPDALFATILAGIETAALTDRRELMAHLRESKRRAALLIALADLGGIWSLEQVTRALTDLADTALRR